MKILLFRHGEASENEPRGLTRKGHEEMAELLYQHGRLDIGNSHSRLVAKQSTAKLLGTSSLEAVRVIPELGYEPGNAPDFNQALEQAFHRGDNLRFLIEESDTYQIDTWQQLHSSSTLAHNMAKLVLESLESTEGHVGLCAREFLIPTFLYAVISKMNGDTDQYLDTYVHSVENRPSGRLYNITVESLENAKDLVLQDSTGVNLTFSKSILRDIVQDHILLLEQKPRMGVYILPVFSDGTIAALKYENGGIYFIGGRLKNDETEEVGLEREVSEEVGLDLASLNDIKKIPQIYTFTQTSGTRMMQTFYWARVNNLAMRYIETGAELIRIPIDCVEELLSYNEAREFYAKYIKDTICP